MLSYSKLKSSNYRVAVLKIASPCFTIFEIVFLFTFKTANRFSILEGSDEEEGSAGELTTDAKPGRHKKPKNVHPLGRRRVR